MSGTVRAIASDQFNFGDFFTRAGKVQCYCTAENKFSIDRENILSLLIWYLDQKIKEYMRILTD